MGRGATGWAGLLETGGDGDTSSYNLPVVTLPRHVLTDQVMPRQPSRDPTGSLDRRVCPILDSIDTSVQLRCFRIKHGGAFECPRCAAACFSAKNEQTSVENANTR